MLKPVTPSILIAPPVVTNVQVGWLQEARVTHVINAAGIPNAAVLEAGGFSFHLAPFIDNGGEQEAFVWEGIRAFVEPVLADPDAILAIHCIGGPRRSVSVAYLVLRLQGQTVVEALATILKALPGENPIYAPFIEAWLTQRQTTNFPIGGA
jgi:hypothetical protein